MDSTIDSAWSMPAAPRERIELDAVVGINEDIKEVMRIANGLNLAAINAMLIAKKIGDASSGFSVVSAELRTFSRRLSEVMSRLMELVSALVREVAGMIRLDKALSLQQATRAAATHYPHWEAMWQRKSEELARSGTAVLNCRANLTSALARADKLCVMGQSLSYSAKIESVYGGEQAGALKHVSEGVEASVREILSTLQKLAGQLETKR